MKTVAFSFKPAGETDESIILVEMSDYDSGSQGASGEVEDPVPVGLRDSAVQQAKVTFNQALSAIGPVASAVQEQLGSLPQRPDEVELELGLKLTGKATAKIVAAGAESHLKLKLKWSGSGR